MPPLLFLNPNRSGGTGFGGRKPIPWATRQTWLQARQYASLLDTTKPQCPTSFMFFVDIENNFDKAWEFSKNLAQYHNGDHYQKLFIRSFIEMMGTYDQLIGSVQLTLGTAPLN